jgi:tRNA modification GTPase
LFRLIDTAGIREHSTDVIELVGIEKSMEKMKSADVVLYIFDINDMGVSELKAISNQFINTNKQFILAGNKEDVITDNAAKEKFSDVENLIFLSAKNNQGVNEIKNALFSLTVSEQPATENVVVTNARHYEALQQVSKTLGDIKQGLDDKIPTDLLALNIRHCLHYISEITGNISNEDVLDFIFSKFCIGK